jgi:membrane fusion protein (multidrug efflux system)
MKPTSVVMQRAVFGLVVIAVLAAVAGVKPVRQFLVGMLAARQHTSKDEGESESTIVVTTPAVRNETVTESFVCQIRSQRHIEVRTLQGGYIEHISIREGQAVKKGDVMFKILPTLQKAKLDAENARVSVATQQFKFTAELAKDKVVSENELSLKKAEMDEARAKANFAAAELNFTDVKAPFDGIVDRLLRREGSLVKEGDMLTTLADNSVMWVYFNVPEKYYLKFMATRAEREKDDRIELVLADGSIFPEPGRINTIEADFNNEDGNIKFRADFPNPTGLLRHGQTGTIKILRPIKDALVIPQRATFELLDKRYVWLVDDKDVARQAQITVKYELEDVFVIDSGLKATDKIVLEGVREVEEGEKVAYSFLPAEQALKSQKFHAE